MSLPPVPAGGQGASGPEVLVAIDVGTSGARASAFDVAGGPSGEVRRAYPTSLPEEGWAEQDARRWETASVSALAGLVRQLGPRCRIRGIGVTGQCPSVVPVDAAGRPLRPGIIYRDNRATAEAQWMCQRLGTRALHDLTGHVPAAFHVGAKILWIRAHEPAVFARTRHFLQPTDFVVQALTGEAGTDWTMAAATALLDLRGRCWATGLLAELDLDPDLLPPLRSSWSVTGHLRPELARRLGLAPGIPVVAGAGDSIACAVGAGVTDPGPVSEMAGSSTCLNSVVDEPVEDEDVTHYPSPVTTRGYLTEVGINTTGEALDWVVQLAYSGPGRHPRGDDYARLDRDAATMPPGSDGLLFVPVLGDGERDDPALRGAVSGLSLRHDHRAWGRAVLEGIAFGIRARVETLGRASAPLTELRVSGGGAGLGSWNQIKADVLGVPVVRVPGDATAAGAAMLAGIGTGVYRDAGEATAAGFHPAARVEPLAQNRDRYDEIYARYRALVGSPVVRIHHSAED
ncbi:MAG: xylulokinase [Candidatus Dormibacteria bacterium]